jgi:hypothetical protein
VCTHKCVYTLCVRTFACTSQKKHVKREVLLPKRHRPRGRKTVSAARATLLPTNINRAHNENGPAPPHNIRTHYLPILLHLSLFSSFSLTPMCSCFVLWFIYHIRFKLAPHFNEVELAHMLLPREGVVSSFVVLHEKSGEVNKENGQRAEEVKRMSYSKNSLLFLQICSRREEQCSIHNP